MGKNMKYIIMCGGNYYKWKRPKQLTLIHGESVAGRTIRLLREAGIHDINISTDNEEFRELGAPLLKHNNQDAWVDAFYPSDRPACYIFGDVVFSPEAIRKIVETETDSIRFFASCPPFAPGYTKKYAEPFAYKVADQERFRSAINFVKANVETGIFDRHPIAWELWQVINGWNVRDINYGSYDVINDYTCDIDDPVDAERIEEVIS